MAGKILTVIVGSFLLIGCLVGIVVLIFGPLSDEATPRDSYKIFHRDHSTVEDWKSKHKIHVDDPAKKEVTAYNDTSELANQFQVLFSKNNSLNRGGFHTFNKEIPPNIVLSNKRFNNMSVSKTTAQTTTTESPTEIPRDTRTNADANTVLKLDMIHQDETQNWRPIISTGNQGHFNRKPVPSSRERPTVMNYVPSVTYTSPEFETSTIQPTDRSHNEKSVATDTQTDNSNEMVEDGNEEEIEEDDQYTHDENEEETDAGASDNGALSLIDFTAMLEQISSLYTQGLPNLHRVFQFLNETVTKENTSGLLTQLNNLYSRPELLQASTFGSDLFSGRNSYESSLAAFVFMSFGVFLLNQIHNLIGGARRADGSEARDFHANSLEMSNLNILFEPPLEERNDSSILSGQEHRSDSESMRLVDFDNQNDLSQSPSNSSVTDSSYVNNMFRALLNLVNAYTKDSQVLECIWSSYCEDLDRTSTQDDLYGIAARINSIGLRLIMHQIPSELTLDVMLRSLLGWDGLPCAKMFPVCHLNSSALVLQFSEDTHQNMSSISPIPLSS